MEEFKCIGGLFTSVGRMEREIDSLMGAALAVFHTLC